MGKVFAVCISEKKGEQKHEVDKVLMKVAHGIVGDAHAGDWHRQVSLLACESVEKARQALDPKLDIFIGNGAFAENILTTGLVLYDLPVGTKLKIGEAVGEVTQIGKQCHDAGCAIRKATGDCVMPREGIFVKILQEGWVEAGDDVLIIEV